jgi:hypothetical protein
MAKSLREQFKATSIKSLRKAIDKDDAMVGVQSNDYLSLEDGKTSKIRIFPAHPDEDNFYVSRMCYWMSFTNDEGEVRRGTVNDSIAHGGTERDIVREYVKFAKKRYGDDADKMEALTGTGMKSNSLNPRYSWLCYADIVREDEELRPKVWEFGKMVRDLLNKLAMSEDDDEPIQVDPYTDVDEGLPILVKYLKNPNKKKGEQYYEVGFAKKPVARPLSDDELEFFANVKPLTELTPKYGMRDFDRALDGLRNFDEENGFDLFDNDEWLDIVEKVKAQYDDTDNEDKPKKKTVTKVASKNVTDDDDDEEETPEPKKKAKPAAKPEPEESEDEPEEEPEDDEEDNVEDESDDEFADMDRTQLKKYIKEKSLEITVKKSMSDDDLREAIRAAVANSDSDEDEEDNADDDDDDEGDASSPSLTLAELRKKLAGKK